MNTLTRIKRSIEIWGSVIDVDCSNELIMNSSSLKLNKKVSEKDINSINDETSPLNSKVNQPENQDVFQSLNEPLNQEVNQSREKIELGIDENVAISCQSDSAERFNKTFEIFRKKYGFKILNDI